jgi:hypothetical protein
MNHFMPYRFSDHWQVVFDGMIYEDQTLVKVHATVIINVEFHELHFECNASDADFFRYFHMVKVIQSRTSLMLRVLTMTQPPSREPLALVLPSIVWKLPAFVGFEIAMPQWLVECSENMPIASPVWLLRVFVLRS